MLAKSLPILAASFVLACSGEMKPSDAPPGNAGSAGTSASAGASADVDAGASGGGLGDQTVILPPALAVSPRPGINSAFNVIALTLHQTARGAELLAAVRNDGDGAACNPYFSAELHDKDDQTLGGGISGLMVRRFYQFTDGTETVAGCVLPGDVSMVALTDLSLTTPIEDIVSVVYASGYWGLPDVVAIDGVSLTEMKAVTRGGGVAYTGALVNRLEVVITHPTVAVFPLNAVGRPLDVAYAGAMLDVPPDGSWNFETETVTEAGVGYDAYPMGGP
jgi:hypothetical protein